jgi:hypothetical protein
VQKRRQFKQLGGQVPPELLSMYESIAGKLGNAAWVSSAGSFLEKEELQFIDTYQYMFSTEQLFRVPNLFMSSSKHVLPWGRSKAVFVKDFAVKFGTPLRDILMGMQLLVVEGEMCTSITFTKNADGPLCTKRRRVGAHMCGNHRDQEAVFLATRAQKQAGQR